MIPFLLYYKNCLLNEFIVEIYQFGIDFGSFFHKVEVAIPLVFLLENSLVILFPGKSNRIDFETRFCKNILWSVKIVVRLKKLFFKIGQ